MVALYDQSEIVTMQKIASPEHFTHELRDILSYAQGTHPHRRRLASQLLSLAERVASVKLSSRGTPLYGHDSIETAYPVDDYPYGHTLRCKIRYWLESHPKKGFRFCSQTENPKNGRWNNPKKSTYNMLAGCMYLDSKEHVVWTGLTEYSGGADILSFVKDFPRADFRILREYSKAKVKYLEKGAAGMIGWAINGVPEPIKEEDIGRYREELEEWRDIVKLIH
jgi:hypothetical protein